MSTSKTYTFLRHRDGQSPERIEKEEYKLTQQEKDFLMGELIQAWNRNTPENQRKFMDSILKEIKPICSGKHFLIVSAHINKIVGCCDETALEWVKEENQGARFEEVDKDLCPSCSQ